MVMDISQSTQTFLLYVTICLVVLIGLFFLFSRNKQEKLSLINAVQTSILVVGFLSLIVFGGSYYFVLSDAKPSDQSLKDALSITASFFGGFATLTAAYIAAKLAINWKLQIKHDKEIDILIEVSSAFSSLHRKIMRLKISKNYVISENIYDLDNLPTVLNQKSKDFEMEVQELELLLDNLDRVIKNLCLISKTQSDYFEDAVHEYFRITTDLKFLYDHFIKILIQGKCDKHSYKSLSSQDMFRVRFSQLYYVRNEDDYLEGIHNTDSPPLFLSTRYMIELNKKAQNITKQFYEDIKNAPT